MTASTWTWIGSSSSIASSGNWQLLSGPGNGSDIPISGDTAIFSGTGVAPQFLDNQVSVLTTFNLDGTGTVQFLNNTSLLSTTSLAAADTINAAGSATAIGISGTLDNAGTIEVTGTNTALTITMGADAALSGFFQNDGSVIVNQGDSLTISGSGAASFNNNGDFLVTGGIATLNAPMTGNGNVSISSGAINANSISENGQGTIAVGGGTVTVAGAATIGQSGSGAALNMTGGNFSAGTLLLGAGVGGSGTLDIVHGVVSSNGSIEIGGQGSAAVTINAGAALSVGSGIAIDSGGASGVGTLFDNGGLEIQTGSLIVGTGGSADAVIQDGGIISLSGSSGSNTIQVGNASTGVASLTINGGVLTASNEAFDEGTGSVLVEGAGSLVTTFAPGAAAVDLNATGGNVAAAQVSGPGSAWNLNASGANFIVGDTGDGSVLISSDGVVNAGTNTLEIGNQSGGSGTVTVDSGGTLQVATKTSSSAAVVLGAATGAYGDLNLSDSGTEMTATGQVNVGGSGNGEVTIANQATVQTGNASVAPSQGIDIAQGTGGLGAVTVDGTHSLLSNAGEFIVGDGGVGSLSIRSGGTVTTTPGVVSGLAGAVIGNTGSASGSSVGVSGVGSNWQINGSLVVGASGFGALDIAQSGSVTATSFDVGQSAGGSGAINVIGTGASLNISGALILGDQGAGGLNISDGAAVIADSLIMGNGGSGAGEVVIGAGSTLALTTTAISVGVAGSGVLDIEGGTLSLANGTSLSPGTFGRIVQVGGLIDPATVFDASGGSFGGGGTMEASGTVTDTSVATVSGGSETVLAPLITSGDTVNLSGVWSIKSAGTLILNDNTVDISQTFSFGDGSLDVLVIGHQVTLNGSQDPVPISADLINNFAATIQSFFSGDSIVVDTTHAVSFDLSGSVISLVDNIGGATEGTLTFHNAAQASAWKNAAGALQDVSCFAAGTHIRTPTGLIAVEALAVGDEVTTVLGGFERIVWIGQRSVDCARHPGPETVWPVRVAQGAFGANVPVRDLYLSPDHAVFVNDVLVPVKLLINGTTIEQVRRSRVTYYHVELSEHEVILAEDLPVESYLDASDRGNFSGQDVVWLMPEFTARLRPETAMLWEMKGCAPLVTTGEALAAARRKVETKDITEFASRAPSGA